MEAETEAVLRYDVVVVGGGLAGICAAVAAADGGIRVALIHNRGVLGGNASSEIRVWPMGASALGNNRFVEETGYIGEIALESLYRNPRGEPHAVDALLMDFVKRRENLDLFLNLHIDRVETRDGRVSAVSGAQQGTERRIEIAMEMLIDATGDGSVAAWAGCEAMRGREAFSDFQERLAPPQANVAQMGSTLLYYTVERDAPVEFHPFDFAVPWKSWIEKLPPDKLARIAPRKTGCNLWWVEIGGEGDTIAQNEENAQQLYATLYSMWDYIKNSGRFQGVGCLDLEWVGTVAGKRASRRIAGEYVLTQSDLEASKNFEDAVCYGGWPIDTHPPAGMFDAGAACEQAHVSAYSIPMRCLLPKGTSNLVLAGRDISASFLAFSSTRVMKTCALTGQAAGVYALCAVRGKGKMNSAELIRQTQQRLLQTDMRIPGVKRDAQNDSISHARLRASGQLDINMPADEGLVDVQENAYLHFPKLDRPEEMRLHVQCAAESQVCWRVLDARQLHRELAKESIRLSAGENKIAPLPAGIDRPVVIELEALQGLKIATCTQERTGIFGVFARPTGYRGYFYPSFEAREPLPAYPPEAVANGYQHYWGNGSLWISQSLQNEEQWLEVELDQERALEALHICFDSDLNREINILRPAYHAKAFSQMPPQLVKACTVTGYGLIGQKLWEHEIQNNFHRHVRLPIDTRQATQKIRLHSFSTWGGDHVHIYALWTESARGE